MISAGGGETGQPVRGELPGTPTFLLRYSPFVSQVLAERSQLEEARLASQREENYLDRLAQATKQASKIFFKLC